MDERSALLRRLAAAGASPTLQRDCAGAAVGDLRKLVESMEAAPRRPTIMDVWAADAAAYAEAARKSADTSGKVAG
ncbi:MAG: hypothetical protein EBQ89_00160 [Alphaproteobacteria bacterium]|nr:hypothetical protein [Alphaproteobacteria bacterium]